MMHMILGLKLYYSCFQTITIALDNNKWFFLSNHDVRIENSELEVYATSSAFDEKFKYINLMKFFKIYELVCSKVVSRNFQLFEL